MGSTVGAVGAKGISVSEEIFGPISYVYEYDGDKKDAPRPAADEDEWAVITYRDKHNRVASMGNDTPFRADVHTERYNTGTAYSHHAFSVRTRIAEEPRWPCAHVIRGKIHVGAVEDEKGLLKTAPKEKEWWAKAKAQPIKTPTSDRHSRGVHASTFDHPTAPLLVAVDPSGRRREVLQESERINRRFQDQKDAREVVGYGREALVPYVLVAKDTWEDWERSKMAWRDGSERWGRGLSLVDDHVGRRVLLMRRTITVKGPYAGREGLVMVGCEAQEEQEVPLARLMTSWEHARVQKGLLTAGEKAWEVELSAIPLTPAAVFDLASLALARAGTHACTRASLKHARKELSECVGRKLEVGGDVGPSMRAACTYFIPVAVYDEEFLAGIQELREGMRGSGLMSEAQFEEVKERLIKEMKERVMSPLGRQRRGEVGEGMRLLTLTHQLFLLRVGERFAPKTREGAWKGVQVCEGAEKAAERAARAVTRLERWQRKVHEGAQPRSRPRETDAASGEREAPCSPQGGGRSAADVARYALDMCWGIAEVKGIRGRSAVVAPEGFDQVVVVLPTAVSHMNLTSIGIVPWRSPHWAAAGGMALTKEELAARGGLRGPARVGWPGGFTYNWH